MVHSLQAALDERKRGAKDWVTTPRFTVPMPEACTNALLYACKNSIPEAYLCTREMLECMRTSLIVSQGVLSNLL